MALTTSEIAAVVSKLSILGDARVEKIDQPETNRLVLTVYGTAGKQRLLIEAQSAFSRIHLTSSRSPNPPSPYAFQGVCRKHLKGQRLTTISQSINDRTVWLKFNCFQTTMSLVAELSGRHGNLFLLDSDNVVLSSILPNISWKRNLSPGSLYVAPVSQCPKSDNPRFEIDSDPVAFCQEIEAFYTDQIEADNLTQLRTSVSSHLRRDIKRASARVTAKTKDLHRANEALKRRDGALLLKTAPNKERRGLNEIAIDDYSTHPKSTILVKLDPSMSILENMNRIFDRAKRYETAISKIEENIIDDQQRLTQLTTAQQALPTATTETLLRLRASLKPSKQRVPTEKKRTQSKSEPVRHFFTKNGISLIAGKNGDGNHLVTFKIASGNDMWFHVSGSSGAHVVARSARSAHIDQDTLLDAATLAFVFSKSKTATEGTVTYTRVKYVRKIKGARPGTVSISQEKSIRIRRNDDRLKRLLDSEKP